MNNFDTAINEALAEEGLKSNLAAAGLAGAVMFGGNADVPVGTEPNAPIEQPANVNDDAQYANNILARTIWAEGRGERDLDKSLRAIATSIYNRAQEKIGQGKISDDPLAYAKVTLTPYQYSAWNGWTIKNPTEYPDAKDRSGRGWNEAQKIASEMTSGTFKPLPELEGVTHYFNPRTSNPGWGKDKEFVQIGNHRFLKDRQNFPSPRLGDRG